MGTKVAEIKLIKKTETKPISGIAKRPSSACIAVSIIVL
jgi:hypothetical protein